MFILGAKKHILSILKTDYFSVGKRLVEILFKYTPQSFNTTIYFVQATSVFLFTMAVNYIVAETILTVSLALVIIKVHRSQNKSTKILAI
jgi:hypothetical protein